MRHIDADAVCERCRKSGAICTGSDCEIPTMPTLTPPNEWVRVEDRLPEKRQEVLCYFKYEPESPDVVCQNVYVGSGVWQSESGRVTHWMLLPEPPARPKE